MTTGIAKLEAYCCVLAGAVHGRKQMHSFFFGDDDSPALEHGPRLAGPHLHIPSSFAVPFLDISDSIEDSAVYSRHLFLSCFDSDGHTAGNLTSVFFKASPVLPLWQLADDLVWTFLCCPNDLGVMNFM
jgi:hypothetical protein